MYKKKKANFPFSFFLPPELLKIHVPHSVEVLPKDKCIFRPKFSMATSEFGWCLNFSST